jgi:hypothetical protein
MAEPVFFTETKSVSNTPDLVFTARLGDLQHSAARNGLAFQGNNTTWTTWMVFYSDKPAGSIGKVLDGFNQEEFVKAFDRTKLNTDYLKLAHPIGTPASYRDLQVLKVQLDYLAGMERDLRMRYRSRVRMLAHGTARLISQGLDMGPVNNGIVNFVKRLADRV